MFCGLRAHRSFARRMKLGPQHDREQRPLNFIADSDYGPKVDLGAVDLAGSGTAGSACAERLEEKQPHLVARHVFDGGVRLDRQSARPLCGGDEDPVRTDPWGVRPPGSFRSVGP
jgi:hypothetical protein